MLRTYAKPILGKYRLILIFALFILLLNHCEPPDKYYRPDLPEKLCCYGIIDIDGTTHYLSEFPEFLDNRYSTRYISIEKSFQNEYSASLLDSLRDFSFSISTRDNQIFSYKNSATVKNLVNFPLSDSLKFLTAEKYFLKAEERNSPEINAEVIIPKPPSKLNLISVRKEMIALSEPMDRWPLDIISSIKSVEINLSFDNDPSQKKYYALLIVSNYLEITNISFSGFLNFEIKESNALGFFAELQGLKVRKNPNFNEYNNLTPVAVPLEAYFIDGSKITGDKCRIALLSKFHGPFSTHHPFNRDMEIYTSLRIKLLSIPEEMYNYERGLYTYEKVKDDPFSEPVYLNGNIKNGNGIFAICRSTQLDIDLSPPY